MPVSPSFRPQQFESKYRESRALVRRAHERAEAAAERAQRVRAQVHARRHGSGAPPPAELAVEEANRAARETERFIAVVSHELRQPLNAALAAFGLLEANPGSDVSEKATRIVHRQLLHMSRLLDDLLDMSRLTMEHLRLERARFDLRTAIEPSIEIVAGRAEERGQTMRVALPSKPVEVFGDAARLEQVFANLLSNAVRYTPHGGAITVTLGVDGEWAVVEVIDTGDGIAADDLARIFDPFSRGTSGNAEGLGIGLTLVRGLVELHGGSVQAESPGAGGGSTFTVRLPVVR